MRRILIGLLLVEVAFTTWVWYGWPLSKVLICVPMKAHLVIASAGTILGYSRSAVVRERLYTVGAEAQCWEMRQEKETDNPSNIIRGLRSEPWEPALRHASQATGVPVPLLNAMVAVESNGNPMARSPKGARGLMQLLPSTAVQLGARTLEELDDPRRNVLLGSTYMRQLLDEFGSVQLALAAYNAGPNYIRSGRTWPAETREYVERVLSRL